MHSQSVKRIAWMQSADEKIPKQISSHDISKDVKRISSRVLVPRTSLVEQVLTRAQEVAGAPLLATPHSGMLLQEAEALEAISTLLKQVNRRGFW